MANLHNLRTWIVPFENAIEGLIKWLRLFRDLINTKFEDFKSWVTNTISDEVLPLLRYVPLVGDNTLTPETHGGFKKGTLASSFYEWEDVEKEDGTIEQVKKGKYTFSEMFDKVLFPSLDLFHKSESYSISTITPLLVGKSALTYADAATASLNLGYWYYLSDGKEVKAKKEGGVGDAAYWGPITVTKKSLSTTGDHVPAGSYVITWTYNIAAGPNVLDNNNGVHTGYAATTGNTKTCNLNLTWPVTLVDDAAGTRELTLTNWGTTNTSATAAWKPTKNVSKVKVPGKLTAVKVKLPDGTMGNVPASFFNSTNGGELGAPVKEEITVNGLKRNYWVYTYTGAGSSSTDYQFVYNNIENN